MHSWPWEKHASKSLSPTTIKAGFVPCWWTLQCLHSFIENWSLLKSEGSIGTHGMKTSSSPHPENKNKFLNMSTRSFWKVLLHCIVWKLSEHSEWCNRYGRMSQSWRGDPATKWEPIAVNSRWSVEQLTQLATRLHVCPCIMFHSNDYTWKSNWIKLNQMDGMAQCVPFHSIDLI